jgi:hypothetical protein
MHVGRVPTRPLDALLDMRADSYTIYSEDGDTDDWNGSSSLVDTGTSAYIDVYGHRSRPESYPTGETRETSLSALMASSEKSADITDGNCIVHGGQVFEMTVDPWPSAENVDVYQISLDERTDLTVP